MNYNDVMRQNQSTYYIKEMYNLLAFLHKLGNLFSKHAPTIELQRRVDFFFVTKGSNRVEYNCM